MPTAARFGGSRIWLWSAAFALWVVVWPGLILVLASPRRDIVVAWVEHAAHMPVVAVFLSLAVGAFLLMAAMLTLRRRFDIEGEAASAMRWSLSSRSLDALVGLIVLLVLVAVVLAMRFDENDVARMLGAISISLARFAISWWWLYLIVFVGFLPICLPFFLFNPATLQRARLQRWWRPSWPGTLAVVLFPLLWFSWPALVDVGMSWLPDRNVISWLCAPVSWLLISAAELVALAFWLNRSAISPTRNALRRMATVDFLRRYMALQLGWWAVSLPFVVALLVMRGFALDIAPQFDTALQSDTLAGSSSLRALLALSKTDAFVVLLLPLPAIELFLALSTGRLLIRLGLVPAAPTDGGSPG